MILATVAMVATGTVVVAADVDPQLILSRSTTLRADVLELAVTAYERVAAKGLVRRPVLTIIDYELPSYEKRLWVINMESGQVLHEEWVAHGMGRPRGSGGTMTSALSFSNRRGSCKSSLGLFMTAETYFGGHGYSLRLDGLETGYNNNARDRLIVLHGAHYVTKGRAQNHLIGRSWGCPAVRPEISKELIDSIKGGAVLWVYYPEPQWLEGSDFLEAGEKAVPAEPSHDPQGQGRGTPE